MSTVIDIRRNSSASNPRRFAFVVPRFGKETGGAETLCREIAIRLCKRGDKVDILTTCAKDNRSWENALPEGEEIDNQLVVKRFKVDDRNLEVWIPHQISIHEGINPGINAQLDWLTHSVNSTGLYSNIKQNADRYDAIFFAPYLFGTTFWGSLIRPDKSVLIPCLHDENYSYLESIAAMFKTVKGCMFNAIPEMNFARSLYGQIPGGEVGMGFESFSDEYIAELVPYFEKNLRYILYVGRKETGKNAHKLIDDFIYSKDNGKIPEDIKLVISGGGSFSDLHRPSALKRNDIIDQGFVSELDKHRIIKHSQFLCQPSKNESFSIVIMEAWLLNTPVLVDSGCAVTRAHVIESNGGLYYESAQEFSLVSAKLINNKDLRVTLANLGNAYVKNKYSWSAVLDRFDSVLETILQ